MKSEVQYILNSRPLQHVGDTDLDFATICPNDLIYGRNFQNLPPAKPVKRDFVPDSVFLDKRMKYLEKIENIFYRCFRDQYLTGLSMYHFGARGRAKTPCIQPRLGELVLDKLDNTPRALWRVAKVTELITGADGIVRKCQIIHQGVNPEDGRSGPTFRAVDKLVPLELAASREEQSRSL